MDNEDSPRFTTADEKEIKQIIYNLIVTPWMLLPAGSYHNYKDFLKPEAIVLAVQRSGAGH